MLEMCQVGHFKEVGHFEAKFQVNIYGPLHAGMVILQLCLWKLLYKETL